MSSNTGAAPSDRCHGRPDDDLQHEHRSRFHLSMARTKPPRSCVVVRTPVAVRTPHSSTGNGFAPTSAPFSTEVYLDAASELSRCHLGHPTQAEVPLAAAVPDRN